MPQSTQLKLLRHYLLTCSYGLLIEFVVLHLYFVHIIRYLKLIYSGIICLFVFVIHKTHLTMCQ